MAFATVDAISPASIAALHPDIIRTHILTRLDGPTLASAASTSSLLRTLCTEQKLWRDLSVAAWPSIDDPRVRLVISSFPAGYRSFFADSHPFVQQISPAAVYELSISLSTELISAVDLYYRGELLYSKVQEIETETGWFMSSPFLVDILYPKETIHTRIRYPGRHDENWVRHMEKNLTLNWILIDPTRKRAANISSRAAVTAQRNWLTGCLEIRYTTVVTAAAEVTAVVACEVDDDVRGEVHVRHVSLEVEDIEGKCLNGRDSLVILQGMMEGKRGKGGEEDSKMKYKEFEGLKKQRRQRKEKREKAKDMYCMILGFSFFLVFWGVVLLR